MNMTNERIIGELGFMEHTQLVDFVQALIKTDSDLANRLVSIIESESMDMDNQFNDSMDDDLEYGQYSSAYGYNR